MTVVTCTNCPNITPSEAAVLFAQQWCALDPAAQRCHFEKTKRILYKELLRLKEGDIGACEGPGRNRQLTPFPQGIMIISVAGLGIDAEIMCYNTNSMGVLNRSVRSLNLAESDTYEILSFGPKWYRHGQ